MLQFTADLWQSIFTPGTTPTLVLATHITFAVLVLTLTIFAFLTKSIHIINLLVLALLLWGILTWFIRELDIIHELEQKEEEKKAAAEQKKGTAAEHKDKKGPTPTPTPTATVTATKSTNLRKRKA